jgi:dienelactone hydrolase
MLKYIFLSLLMASLTNAAIKTETVTYKEGQAELEGYIAYDDTKTSPMPAVIIVHDWMGPGEYTQMRAKQLAELGYYAFAADIYGKSVRPKNAEEAGKIAGEFRNGDRRLLRARGKAAYDFVKKQKQVQKSKISAMGYCFGGSAVLEMGRAGLPLKGILSFHGGLSNPHPEDTKNIKSKLLVMHGAIDPYVSAEEVASFKKELYDAKIDYELIMYSGAVHAFTQKHVGNNIKSGAAYNESANRRSFESMKDFLTEVNQ